MLRHGVCAVLCIVVGARQNGVVVAGQSDEAVREIRDVLKAKSVDCLLLRSESFDPTSFDPKKFDPMLLEAAWEHIRPNVCEILERKLNIHLGEGALPLYFGKVSGGCCIATEIVVSRTRRGVFLSPRSYVVQRPTRYQLEFLVTDPAITSVLRKVLDLSDQCFVRWKPVWETRTICVDASNVQWENIGAATSQFMGSCPEIANLGFSVRAPIYLENKLQVVTSWKQFREHGGFLLFWRLLFQVKKPIDGGSVEITVRGQVGRCLPGQPTTHIEYLGTEEFDSRYTVSLRGGEIVDQKHSYVDDGPAPGPRPEEANSISDSGRLSTKLLNAYLKQLAGKMTE